MRNPTLLQCFHWYYPTGGELWREVTALAPNLNEIGINMVWLPPAYKGASGGYSVGYDSYDLFDLGEFDQKGSVATKYGDKAQLLEAINALKVTRLRCFWTWWSTTKWGPMRRNPSACSAWMRRIAPKSAMRSSNAKPGRATPFPFGPASIRSSSGITNALAVSTTLKTPMRTVSSKS